MFREETKARENKLRRMAKRQGFIVTKSRRRDPKAHDFDKWYIRREIHYQGDHRYVPGYRITLDQLETFLLS